MGGGIMPICIKSGTLCILLGQERFDKKWSDFGGSKNARESYIRTALREGEEELNGILGTGKYLENLVKKNQIACIHNGENYKSFAFKIPYDYHLPLYFNNNNMFIEKNLKTIIENSHRDHSGLFEKQKIKWFTIDEIKNNYDIFRPHFIPILKTIVTNKSVLKDSIIKLNTNSHKQ